MTDSLNVTYPIEQRVTIDMAEFVVRSATIDAPDVTVSVVRSDVTSEGFIRWDYRVSDGVDGFDSLLNPGTSLESPAHWSGIDAVEAIVGFFGHYAEVASYHDADYIRTEYATVSSAVWAIASRNAETFGMADVEHAQPQLSSV